MESTSLITTLTALELKILVTAAKQKNKEPIMWYTQTIDDKLKYLLYLYIYTVDKYVPISVNTSNVVSVFGNFESLGHPIWTDITCSEFSLATIIYAIRQVILAYPGILNITTLILLSTQNYEVILNGIALRTITKNMALWRFHSKPTIEIIQSFKSSFTPNVSNLIRLYSKK